MKILTGMLVTGQKRFYRAISDQIFGTSRPGPARNFNPNIHGVNEHLMPNPMTTFMSENDVGIVLCFANHSSDDPDEACIFTCHGIGWFLLEHLEKVE